MPPKKYNDFIEGEHVEKIAKQNPKSSNDLRNYVPITCPHCTVKFVEIASDRITSNKASECRDHLKVCKSAAAKADPRRPPPAPIETTVVTTVSTTLPPSAAAATGNPVEPQTSSLCCYNPEHVDLQSRLRELEHKQASMEETLKDHSKLLEMGGRMLSHVVGEETTIQMIGEAVDPPVHVASMVSAYISTPSGMRTFNLDHLTRSKHEELMGVKIEEIGRLKERMESFGTPQFSEREKALIAENESLRRCKLELEEKTVRLETRANDKQKELDTLRENMRMLKAEDASYASMKLAHKHSRLYIETCYEFGKAMDFVLRHTSFDLSNTDFHKDLFAYSQGLRQRARVPPNLRPFVNFQAHSDDDSGDDEDLQGIDDSDTAGPSNARCPTPVPASTTKRSAGCSSNGARSRPSSRASHASSSKRQKGKELSFSDYSELAVRGLL
jgi:hypothetical protein